MAPTLNLHGRKRTPDMTPTTCIHHWAIEPANGPWSSGQCLKCQETRQFANSLYELFSDNWKEVDKRRKKALREARKAGVFDEPDEL